MAHSVYSFRVCSEHFGVRVESNMKVNMENSNSISAFDILRHATQPSRPVDFNRTTRTFEATDRATQDQQDI